jgi:predicted house-cleaning noncanonical NTP pyrophosphatase (MazG superfamily)
MSELVYNKLVRDAIPEIIEADSAVPYWHRLSSDEDYKRALLEKLVEEAKELLESDGSLEERADVAEVLKALDEVNGQDAQMIEAARAEKAHKRGGFASRIYLEKAVKND